MQPGNKLLGGRMGGSWIPGHTWEKNTVHSNVLLHYGRVRLKEAPLDNRKAIENQVSGVYTPWTEFLLFSIIVSPLSSVHLCTLYI